jgi:hypothetical protein
VLIRINWLPVSVTRWQHWSQICFETLFNEKLQKSYLSTTTCDREKISLGILEILGVSLTTFKNYEMLLIQLATDIY